MAANPTTARARTTLFPTEEVRRCVRAEVTQVAENAAAIREPWEPDIDSLVLVSIFVAVEAVLPGFPIAPEKMIRRGGYRTVDEAVRDVTGRLQQEWERHHS